MSNVITKKDKDKVLNYMINQNDKTYNILKAAEELQELSLVLIQSLSKGVEEQEIIDEIEKLYILKTSQKNIHILLNIPYSSVRTIIRKLRKENKIV